MNSIDAFYANRWAEFQHLPSMIDHWYWRSGWHVGRSFYTWHLTFSQDKAVQRLADIYHSRIRLPFLDAVPSEWLHLTMQGIGFADKVSAHDLRKIRNAARIRCSHLVPFKLLLGPADADEQGIPLAIHPWEPLIELRNTLREAIAAVWGAEAVPEPADGFHPHVTLFYSNTAADPAPLRPLLQALRTVPPVTTTVTTATLIKLDRDHKIYQWETIDAVPLSGHD